MLNKEDRESILSLLEKNHGYDDYQFISYYGAEVVFISKNGSIKAFHIEKPTPTLCKLHPIQEHQAFDEIDISDSVSCFDALEMAFKQETKQLFRLLLNVFLSILVFISIIITIFNHF